MKWACTFVSLCIHRKSLHPGKWPKDPSRLNDKLLERIQEHWICFVVLAFCYKYVSAIKHIGQTHLSNTSTLLYVDQQERPRCCRLVAFIIPRRMPFSELCGHISEEVGVRLTLAYLMNRWASDAKSTDLLEAILRNRKSGPTCTINKMLFSQFFYSVLLKYPVLCLDSRGGHS